MVCLDSVCGEKIFVWVLILWSLHGARILNQIWTQWPEIALTLKVRGSQPYLDRRRDSLIPEIPRGMQPGPVSSSRCGRWIGAHQWLAELISTNCSTLLELLSVREGAGLKRFLQVYCLLCWCMMGESQTIPSCQNSSKSKCGIKQKYFSTTDLSPYVPLC